MKRFWIWGICFSILFFGVFSIHCFADETNRLRKEQIVYEGSIRPFHLGGGSNETFYYGMAGFTFNPNGDPNGSKDGYPGSLFAIGHTYGELVGEFGIPSPKKSNNFDDLPVGEMLQGLGDLANFSAIRSAIESYTEAAGDGSLTIDTLDGLVYVRGKERADDRIFWTVNKYYNAGHVNHPSIGMSHPNTGNPQAKGVWRLGPSGDATFHAKSYSDYLFRIPRDWADQYVGGKFLAAGLSGGPMNQSYSHGPALYAFAPPNPNDSPSMGASLDAQILLRYPPHEGKYPGWTECDVWDGGAWVEAGGKSAVLFVGTKGLGSVRYGEPTSDSCHGGKGYHCDPYEGQIVLYDPDELAEVAQGKKEPWEVLPYAVISESELDLPFENCGGGLSEVAYDPVSKKLYIVEHIPGGKVPIHVFGIQGDAQAPAAPSKPANLTIREM
jgi:hypothetical protein